MFLKATTVCVGYPEMPNELCKAAELITSLDTHPLWQCHCVQPGSVKEGKE